MTAAEFAPTVRNWMRVGTTVTDDEIAQCIDAGLLDLQGGGVDNLALDDSLIQQAIKDYCKSHYGYDSDAERYASAYNSLKISLSMDSRYAQGVNLRG